MINKKRFFSIGIFSITLLAVFFMLSGIINTEKVEAGAPSDCVDKCHVCSDPERWPADVEKKKRIAWLWSEKHLVPTKIPVLWDTSWSDNGGSCSTRPYGDNVFKLSKSDKKKLVNAYMSVWPKFKEAAKKFNTNKQPNYSIKCYINSAVKKAAIPNIYKHCHKCTNICGKSGKGSETLPGIIPIIGPLIHFLSK